VQKNHRIVLKIGGKKIYDKWASTMDEGDELALRYFLKQAIKDAIEKWGRKEK